MWGGPTQQIALGQGPWDPHQLQLETNTKEPIEETLQIGATAEGGRHE